MLREATQELFDTLRDERTSERTINRAAKAWMKALETPNSLGAIIEAQEQLAGAINWENIERAQLALMMSGALVEQGFAPEPLIEAFAPVLPRWLDGANQLLERTLVGSKDEELTDTALQNAAAQMPDAARDWQQLESLYFPLVAALSVSPSARAEMRPLLPQLAPLTDYLESASYLSTLLQVLDSAPLVVIEPARKRGFVGAMSGIADVFQLHALLMAHYPDAGEISDQAATVFRGDGPQTTERTLTGAWNLYNYSALDSNGNLPTDLSDSRHWIWNEDLPFVIEQFEGRRAILLGPASYERNWKVQRLFAPLRAHVEVERELSAGEVEQWLGRMAQAKKAN